MAYSGTYYMPKRSLATDITYNAILCSCCLTGENLINMSEDFDYDGKRESYFDAVNRCYNLEILDPMHPADRRYICDTCVQRLVDSFTFRCQVIATQSNFQHFMRHTEEFVDPEMEEERENYISRSIKDNYLFVNTVEQKENYDVDHSASDFDSQNDDDQDWNFSYESERSKPMYSTSAKTSRKAVIKKAVSNWDSRYGTGKTKKRHSTAVKSPRSRGDWHSENYEAVAEERYTAKKSLPRSVIKGDPDVSNENLLTPYPAKTRKLSPRYLEERKARKAAKSENREMLAVMDLENKRCRICLATFRSHVMLSMHLNTHFPNFGCETCGKKFATLERMTLHRRRHIIKDYKCEKCGVIKKSIGQYKNHLNTHDEVMRCPICDMRFPTIYMRRKHDVEKHSIASNFVCPVCGKDCLTGSMLSKHNGKEHSVRERTFECDICQKRFQTKAILVYHMGTHYDKRWECQLCGKRFSRKTRLKPHLKIHLEIKEEVCNHCGKTFVEKTALSSHLKRIHGLSMHQNNIKSTVTPKKEPENIPNDKVQEAIRYLLIECKQELNQS